MFEQQSNTQRKAYLLIDVSVGNFNRLIWIFEGIKNNHRGNIFGARFTLKLHDLNRL